MSDVKDLISSIISGEDYNDVFKSVMANKVSDMLDRKREEISRTVISKSSVNEWVDVTALSMDELKNHISNLLRSGKNAKNAQAEMEKRLGVKQQID